MIDHAIGVKEAVLAPIIVTRINPQTTDWE
jgi:hypothetical protein